MFLESKPLVHFFCLILCFLVLFLQNSGYDRHVCKKGVHFTAGVALYSSSAHHMLPFCFGYVLGAPVGKCGLTII